MMRMPIGKRRTPFAYFAGAGASWSSTRFTSRSASAFSLRGTWRMSTSEKPRKSCCARRCKRLKSRVLHAILAEELTHHELRIEPHVQARKAALGGCFEAQYERRPLGDIVRRNAEVGADLFDHLAAGVKQHRGARRGAGIAARAAVGKERCFHAPAVRRAPGMNRPAGG